MSQDPRGKPGPPRGARGRPTRPTRATYWRRRVTVLVVAIGLLTALGWGVSALLAPRPTADAALTSNTTAAGPAHAHRHRKHLHPAPSPSPRHAPARSRHRRPASSRPTGKVLSCAPGTVTLILYSPQYWYQAGATPRFTVRARAQGQPCRFAVSSRSVSVVVTAAGHHIWSSADCASGGGARAVLLPATRPAVILRVSWDRRTSAPGCTGASRLVRPGEYKVTAVAGHLHSPAANLVLGAAGASGP
jgi:hypothetical protein